MKSATYPLGLARILACLLTTGLGACVTPNLDDFEAHTPKRCASSDQGGGASKSTCSSAALTAGASSGAKQGDPTIAAVVADKGGQYVDELAHGADGLPPAFSAVVQKFMALADFPDAFTDADLQRARILPATSPGAGALLTSNHAAITLDQVVIFEANRYQAIATWNASWDDVVAGNLDDDQDRGLYTALHELVHVRQFRERGRERFLSEYLGDALRNGEHSVELEREAYAIAPDDDSWARRAIRAESSGSSDGSGEEPSNNDAAGNSDTVAGDNADQTQSDSSGDGGSSGESDSGHSQG